MKTLSIICRWIDGLNEWVGRAAAFAALGLVLVVFTDVVMRYLFHTSFVFIQELEWHLYALVFLIGAGYTLRHDGHVRVDIVYQRLRPSIRAWIDLIGVVVFLIPGCVMVIITSFKFSYVSWSILEGSPDPGGIPFRFLIKGAITVGFSLILIQGASMGIHSLLRILGKEGPEEHRS